MFRTIRYYSIVTCIMRLNVNLSGVAEVGCWDIWKVRMLMISGVVLLIGVALTPIKAYKYQFKVGHYGGRKKSCTTAGFPFLAAWRFLRQNASTNTAVLQPFWACLPTIEHRFSTWDLFQTSSEPWPFTSPNMACAAETFQKLRRQNCRCRRRRRWTRRHCRRR